MQRLKSVAQLVGLLTAEVLAIVALHGLGQTMGVPWQDLPGWLERISFQEAAVAVLRLVALALAYWLAASTVLYTLAVASRLPSAIRAVEWATLPIVQRLAQRAAAATLATVLTAPGLAAPGLAGTVLPIADSHDALGSGTPITASEEPPVGVTDAGIILPPGLERPAYTPVPAPDTPQARPTAPVAPPPAVADPAPVAESLDLQQTVDHEVLRGEHLWGISAAHLALVTGRQDLTDADIAPYWAQVVEANTARLRSGNPDVIHPGEIVHLPPVQE